jgi:hypothetical protein
MELIHVKINSLAIIPGVSARGSTMTKADNRIAFNHKAYYGLIIRRERVGINIFVYSSDENLNNIKGSP